MQTTSAATMSRRLRDLGRTASQAVHRCAGPMIDLVTSVPFDAASPCRAGAAACTHQGDRVAILAAEQAI